MKDSEQVYENLKKIFRKRGVRTIRDRIRCLTELTGTVGFTMYNSSEYYTPKDINKIPNCKLSRIEGQLFSIYYSLENGGCWDRIAA